MKIWEMQWLAFPKFSSKSLWACLALLGCKQQNFEHVRVSRFSREILCDLARPFVDGLLLR
jgi:hypothetical protein